MGLTPAVITAAAVSLAAAGTFAALEPRSGHPMLPLELFRSRQFAAATVLALVAYAALGGVIFLFVAFLQITLGYTALQAGAATLIAVAALPLAAGLSGAAFENPARMAAGFPVAMTIAAGTSLAAALLAWTTISDNALNRPAADAEPVANDLPPSLQRHCAVAGTPLTASANPRPSSRPPPAKES